MLLMFGYALSLDVDRIPTIVYDLDHSAAEPRTDSANSAARAISRSSRRCDGYRPIEQAMDQRRALLGVVIPAGLFAQSARGRAKRTVQILLDGSDSNTASIAQGYAEGLVQTYARTSATMRKACAPGSVPPVGVSAECASGTTPTWCRAIHRAGTDRRDHDDHHRQSELAHHRARMGKRHHGAVALDAGAARRSWRWANCPPTFCWA